MAVIIQVTWKRDLVVRDTHVTRLIRPSELTKDHLFGRYVVDYDPTVDGEGNYGIVVCDDRKGARRFPSREHAIEYFTRASPNAVDRGTGERSWRPLSQQYYAEYHEV